jgi:hypothetical protein
VRLAAFLVMAGMAAAACSPSMGADEGPLDEVLVKGRSGQLSALRREAVELEERFYDRYNELNPVDDFDVHCYTDARIGTLIKGRICRAVYESKALADEGREAFQFRQFILEQVKLGAPDPIAMGGPPSPAVMLIEARRPAFQKNMREVVGHDEQLIKLLHDRSEALRQYDTLRQQLFGLGSSGAAAAK